MIYSRKFKRNVKRAKAAYINVAEMVREAKATKAAKKKVANGRNNRQTA